MNTKTRRLKREKLCQCSVDHEAKTITFCLPHKDMHFGETMSWKPANGYAVKIINDKGDTSYYVDYDKSCNLWCVFGDHSGFAYASYVDEQEAEDKACQMNGEVNE